MLTICQDNIDHQINSFCVPLLLACRVAATFIALAGICCSLLLNQRSNCNLILKIITNSTRQQLLLLLLQQQLGPPSFCILPCSCCILAVNYLNGEQRPDPGPARKKSNGSGARGSKRYSCCLQFH